MSESESSAIEKPAPRKGVPKRTAAQIVERYELLSEKAGEQGMAVDIFLDHLPVDSIEAVRSAPDDSYVDFLVHPPHTRSGMTERYHLLYGTKTEESPGIEAAKLYAGQARSSVQLTETCLNLCFKLVDAAGKMAASAVKSTRKMVKARKRADEVQAAQDGGIPALVAELAGLIPEDKRVKLLEGWGLLPGEEPKKSAKKPARKAPKRMVRKPPKKAKKPARKAPKRTVRKPPKKTKKGKKS